MCLFFFFNDTATTEIYTLSLHDALPILVLAGGSKLGGWASAELPDHHARLIDYLNASHDPFFAVWTHAATHYVNRARSEEHTSELQSRLHLVCRLLLEKKK